MVRLAHWGTTTALLALLVACGGYGAPGEGDPNNPGSNGGGSGNRGGPGNGAMPEYVSANPNGGGGYGGGYYVDVGYGGGGYADAGMGFDAETTSSADAGTSPTEPGSSPDVTRGDIFRVLGDDLILNLNIYRGLQVIDISDVSQPRVIGRLELGHNPVELQVLADRAYVLSNGASQYESERYGEGQVRSDGAVVQEVDLSNPEKLRLISEYELEGHITTSRMVTDGESGALYVVTYEWQSSGGYGADTGWGYSSSFTSEVSSFDLSGDELEFVSSLELAGGNHTISATPEVMLVAHEDYSGYGYGTQITLLDISDLSGHMVLGGSVTIEGIVESLFNLDFYNGVLRVVSTDWRTNHVYTFDATDRDAIVALDHQTFGDNEDLYATLFLGNKAFFVTYFRVDPFHAFEITDEGEIIERSEFVVSGWNDFFVPVFGGDRLIGIGTNDEGASNTMAVSLYDSDDLSNTEPLIERADVEAETSWAQGSWDDRAFSVLQNSVEVETTGGTVETGLILLPFSGYDSGTGHSQSAVQIYTFSRDTLTRRGVMVQNGSTVRRSFVAADDTTANLSNNKMTLFDHANPDAPTLLGEVELAPNFRGVLSFGAFVARINASYEEDYFWLSDDDTTTVEIISTEANVDLAPAEATIEIPGTARVHGVGDLLVGIDQSHGSTIALVHDMSDPLDPAFLAVGENAHADCANCYYPSWYEPLILEDALVDTTERMQNELAHTLETCWSYPLEGYDCWYDDECEWYDGYVECISRDGAEPTCNNEVRYCSYNTSDGYYGHDCVPVDDFTDIPMDTYCYEYDEYRYWSQYQFEIVDLTEPSSPQISSLAMDREEHGVSVIHDENRLLYTFSQPVWVDGDSFSYLAYYLRELDLTEPSEPVTADPINIPGYVIATFGDRLIARYHAYGDDADIGTHFTQFHIEEGRAVIDGQADFSGRVIDATVMDERGFLLVSHNPEWGECNTTISCYLDTLTILDASSDGLNVVGEVEVDQSARWMGAESSRAVYGISGGVLVVNLEDVTDPFPQAFHRVPNEYWYINAQAISDTEVFVAAGNYGLYRFSLFEQNLE